MLAALSFLDLLNSGLDLYLNEAPLGSWLEGTSHLWWVWRNLLVAISWLLFAFPASVVMVSMWVYRAYGNLAALGEAPRTSPAWAVGWFYIPIANLWKPYQVVREIWDETLHRSPGGLVAGWWACWLGAVLTGNFQMEVSIRLPASPEPRTLALLLSFPPDVLFIAAAVLLIRIVLTVTGAQESRHADTRRGAS